MSDRKPFWTSIPGVATGAAGVVSAIVGLLGVSAQLGWIGGDGDGDATPSTTTIAGETPSSTASTGAGATTTTATAARAGQFEVDPTSLALGALGQPRDASVTVRNTGEVPLTMQTPTISGPDDEQFEATDVSCTKSALPAGRSCQVKVTLTPQRAGAQFSAVLVVAAANAPREVEVELQGTALLG